VIAWCALDREPKLNVAALAFRAGKEAIRRSRLPDGRPLRHRAAACGVQRVPGADET
jgi:hypothetical protein